ncbi:exosome complex component RRP43 [Sporobolomyces salmoneus]|uniref:exosome complex component RRP43 n=1 Tax=Sporobolomyces salmoneus TaxID=183962 RepID=UPI00317D54EA
MAAATASEADSTPIPTASSTLTPALFKRLHPQPYLSKFLDERVRPDGRPLGTGKDVWRDASVNLGSVSTAPSSALVRLGKTTVVCGITLEIAPTDISTPYQGFIVPNIDMSPLCSPLFRPGPPSDESQVLSSRLKDILISSNLVSLESLCIEPGKSAFVLYLDLVCLNYDGGVLDAALLACVGALKSLNLPQAEFDVDSGETICEPISAEFPGRRIQLESQPCAISFGYFNGHLLPDPTLFESQLSTSQITIVLDATRTTRTKQKGDQELLGVYQAGAPMSGGKGREVLKTCIEMAKQRAEELSSLL